ncbi:MAG TPA: enoyl-CoA hydratase [Reyranella sp.]|nr:enoyl-CoA hydratase [Reyranella sp.]
MTTYSTLLTERIPAKDGAAVLKITTNRPEVLNAQSRVLLEELDDAFRRAVDDEAVRVIILAGAGKHFSAGHDLGSPQEMADQKKTPLEPGFKGEYRRLWERFFENTMRWRDLPKPTIAQVQGYCIMGGLMIASACDLIIASDDAQFADRAVKWGGSHVQYFSMPWDFGPRKTKEYLFTGRFISAAEAERAGLVNRVVPREKLEEETMALAQDIAERDPYAMKLAKASVNETLDAQGFRQAMENAFKNYMLTIPHRMEMGTYGPAAREKAPKDRFAVLNKKAS